jgi:hypothetical protein
MAYHAHQESECNVPDTQYPSYCGAACGACTVEDVDVRGVGLGDGLKAVLLVDGLPDGRGSVGVAFNDAESIGKHTNKKRYAAQEGTKKTRE